MYDVDDVKLIINYQTPAPSILEHASTATEDSNDSVPAREWNSDIANLAHQV